VARFIDKVGKRLLTARAGETGGGPVDGTLHGESTIAVDESKKHLGFNHCGIREDART
jgi:hypothetical protein